MLKHKIAYGLLWLLIIALLIAAAINQPPM
jgi:hypothetical protein